MKTLLLVYFITIGLLAQPTPPAEIDLRIINLTYNEEFSQAKRITQDLIKSNSSSPKYYYYLTNIMVMEYYQKVSELVPEKRDEGRKALNKEIINYCESIVDRFEDANLNTENKFYFGTIYGYLARVYGVDGSWWSAFRSGMKAKSMMEEVLKNDPKYYDAYLALGMLNYYADRMSGATSFIAGILGFSGDREKGLNYLKTAYNKGTLTWAQSALTLIEVYANLEDNAYAAIPYFESFLKIYPENKRILNSFCQLLLNLWEIKRVDAIIKSDKQNLVENYIKARLNDILGNSELALKYGEAAMNQKSLLRGSENSVRYILAYNSWITGNAAVLKKHEPELNERGKEAIELAKKYPNEAKWVHSFLVKAVAKVSLNEFETFALTKPNFKNTPDFEGQFNLILGQYYFNNNLYDKAEPQFWRTASSSSERNKYSALRFLLEIYNRQNVSPSKVKTLLSLIEDFDNDRLKFRCNDLEKKYNL